MALDSNPLVSTNRDRGHKHQHGGATLVVGVWRPSPLLLVVIMIVIQSWVRTFAVSRWLTTKEGAQQVV